MKRLRIIGISLLALFALGAVTASMALAEEGVLPKPTTTVQVLGTNATLGTAGAAVFCKVLTGTATFTSDSHGTGKLDFNECEVAGLAAFSLGEKETTVVKEALILASVSFLVCLINSAALTFGLFVEVEKEAPVHIHVKAIGSLITVKGAVIGEFTAKKGKLIPILFKGEKGKQAVTECKDEAGGVKKHTLASKTNAEAEVVASENVEKGLLQFTEEVELMDK
jgi:hypothetical protein